MANEYKNFKRGGVSFPLTAATTNSLLQDADPFIFGALHYLNAMLTTHIGSRFTAEAASGRAGLKKPDGSAITAVVGTLLPFPPEPFLNAEQILFPLLAIHRVDETMEYKTVGWRHNVSRCIIAYVLPPLAAAQAQIMWPILNAAARVIDDRVEQQYDPTYTPPFTGATMGSNIWQLAGTEQLLLTRGKFGRWDAAEGLTFPAYVADIEVREREEPHVADFDDLEGLDASVGLPTAGTPSLADLVQLEVDL